jgi:hypothetical protein
MDGSNRASNSRKPGSSRIFPERRVSKSIPPTISQTAAQLSTTRRMLSSAWFQPAVECAARRPHRRRYRRRRAFPPGYCWTGGFVVRSQAIQQSTSRVVGPTLSTSSWTMPMM